MDFTNRWTEKVTLEVSKVWEDGDGTLGRRPDKVTVHVTEESGEDAGEESFSADL